MHWHPLIDKFSSICKVILEKVFEGDENFSSFAEHVILYENHFLTSILLYFLQILSITGTLNMELSLPRLYTGRMHNNQWNRNRRHRFLINSCHSDKSGTQRSTRTRQNLLRLNLSYHPRLSDIHDIQQQHRKSNRQHLSDTQAAWEQDAHGRSLPSPAKKGRATEQEGMEYRLSHILNW